MQSKAHMKDKFLVDLRKARDTYTGDELKQQLHNLRKRLDDPNILSGDVVMNLLLSLRDIQVRDLILHLIQVLENYYNFYECQFKIMSSIKIIFYLL